jgi:hypothetical protein
MPSQGSVRRLFWHPHQKLWNRDIVQLVKRVFGDGGASHAIVAAIIWVDSVLLTARVWARRLQATRAGYRAPSGSSRPKVLYIDAGMCKSGAEIKFVHEWFADRYELHVLGVEAGSAHYHDASAALADLDHVKLRHVAVVGPSFEGDEVRLYNHSSEGTDSLVGEGDYETVPARRLTRLLTEEGWSLEQTPAILRMSIVGAEQQVIEDLVAEGLVGCVDGYYGLWRSPGGTVEEREGFLRMLEQAGVEKVTFNLKDLNTMNGGPPARGLGALSVSVYKGAFRLRRYAIRTDIETSFRVGLGRVKHSGHPAPKHAQHASSVE